ncbi:hypothetical protein LX32DRAFT_305098 [Colletotrichum zoysiae]|uniref:Uncharacterized protein n=1 Tax=Colletotrichum zoysiae TaxID=1216348 RepID=A0AAD9H2K1_9PEZI|nr:hypothetical protein LX32DRAFT_305098 [Colletotrichum zoysiae]
MNGTGRPLAEPDGNTCSATDGLDSRHSVSTWSKQRLCTGRRSKEHSTPCRNGTTRDENKRIPFLPWGSAGCAHSRHHVGEMRELGFPLGSGPMDGGVWSFSAGAERSGILEILPFSTIMSSFFDFSLPSLVPSFPSLTLSTFCPPMARSLRCLWLCGRAHVAAGENGAAAVFFLGFFLFAAVGVRLAGGCGWAGEVHGSTVEVQGEFWRPKTNWFTIS